ncbi:uncharacterized protein LOC131879980 [Tigriopus californicus]|uniref:uncharacterized protein LOC131879980 n=1 Tax=Tigriopus californicus TaxID=6832 RepID=UPI0027DA9B5A|nr:uncharacterized protein LOC131879980 [Tigriopus californicus]
MQSVLMILFLVAIWPCEGSPSTAEIFKRVKVSHQNLCNDLDEERKTCETDLFAKSFETSPYSCEFLLQVLNCSRPWLRNFCVEDPRLSQIQQRTYLIFKMKDQYPEFESCVPSSEKEGCVANQVMVEARNGTKDPLTGIELKKNFTGLALACNDRVTRVADNLSLYLEHAWNMSMFSQSLAVFFFGLVLFKRSAKMFEKKWSLKVTEDCMARKIVANAKKQDMDMRKSTLLFRDISVNS